MATLGADLYNNLFAVQPTAAALPAPGGVDSGLIHWLRADSGTFTDTGGATAANADDEVARWENRAQSSLHVTTPAGFTNADLVAGSAASNFNLALDFERDQNDHLRHIGVVLPTSSDGTIFGVGNLEATTARVVKKLASRPDPGTMLMAMASPPISTQMMGRLAQAMEIAMASMMTSSVLVATSAPTRMATASPTTWILTRTTMA